MQDMNYKSSELEAALNYAQRGWRVLPVHSIQNGKCSCGDKYCSSPGKHPIADVAPHGCHNAITAQDKIREWWLRYPMANVAVATGKASGFFALDVDLPEGMESLKNLETQYGGLPMTVEQITGGGGRHLLFKYPVGVEIRNRTGTLGFNLDVRGEGGYVVVAPSNHLSGKSYTWRPGRGPQELEIAEAPQWLIDLAKSKSLPPKSDLPKPISVSLAAETTPHGRSVLEGEIHTLATIPEGQRNDALNRSAFSIGQLVASGDISLSEAESALRTTGEQMGLTPKEVQATVNSGLKKGMEKPRTIQNLDTIKVPTNKPEPPRPLVREISPSGDYPVEALGQLLGSAVRAIVDVVQVPPALAAGSVLATASLSVQGHADVVLPIGEGYPRPLSLYLITVAESSDRKSTADNYALRAVKEYEAEVEKIHQKKMAAYQQEKLVFDKIREVAIKNSLGKFKKPNGQMVPGISQAISELGNPPEPPLTPYLLVQEPTIEALLKLLQSGSGSLGLFTAEGGQMIGGYSLQEERKLNTLSVFSTLWDAEPVKRIRIMEGFSSLRGKRLAIHLMMQPLVACKILSDPEIAGQGLLSRILITSSESLAGSRLYKEPALTSLNALNEFRGIISDTLKKKLPLAEGTRNELKPRGLTFSPSVKAIWISFSDEVEREIGSGGKYEQIKAFSGKLAEPAARMAGILTLMEDFLAIEISEAAMEKGCTWARFYADEALRLFYLGLTPPDLSEAQKLLDWLHMRVAELISLPEIYQYGPNSIREKSKAAKLVKILEDHGWLNPVPDGAEIQGQHRREVWKIVGPEK